MRRKWRISKGTWGDPKRWTVTRPNPYDDQASVTICDDFQHAVRECRLQVFRFREIARMRGLVVPR